MGSTAYMRIRRRFVSAARMSFNSKSLPAHVGSGRGLPAKAVGAAACIIGEEFYHHSIAFNLR